MAFILLRFPIRTDRLTNNGCVVEWLAQRPKGRWFDSWDHKISGQATNHMTASLFTEQHKMVPIQLNTLTRYTSARQYVMPCESGRRSRDQRPTVKQRFLDVSSNLGKFWKKSLNGHATVVGGHATVGRLSNNVFWTFQAIWENFEKSRWTVTRQWLRSRDRRPTVKQRFIDVSSN